MKLEILNDDNIEIAIKIQKSIFPLEDGSKALIDSVTDDYPSHLVSLKYWLVKKDEKYIGICGLYSYKFMPKDAWLGWFGVVEEERRKGHGTQILNTVINMAKDFGFENFRLYTDEMDNDKAVKLYEKFGMKRETYNNPEDVHFEIGNTLIFSKSLTNTNVDLWGDKNLFINYYQPPSDN